MTKKRKIRYHYCDVRAVAHSCNVFILWMLPFGNRISAASAKCKTSDFRIIKRLLPVAAKFRFDLNFIPQVFVLADYCGGHVKLKLSCYCYCFIQKQILLDSSHLQVDNNVHKLQNLQNNVWGEGGLLQTKASGHKRRAGSNKATLSNFGQIWPRASSVTWDNVEITPLKKKKLHTQTPRYYHCCPLVPIWRKSHLSAILRITSSGQWLNFWGWLKKSACFFSSNLKYPPAPPFTTTCTKTGKSHKSHRGGHLSNFHPG